MLIASLATGINALSAAAGVANASNFLKKSYDSYRKRHLYYPLTMSGVNQAEDSNLEIVRPTIVFTCNQRNANNLPSRIAFPIPQGLDFSDGASYDDTSLGIFNAGASQSLQAAVSKATSGGKAGDIASGVIDSLKSNFTVPAASAGYTAATNLLGLSDTEKSAVGIAMKMTANRNVTTEFSTVGTRNYGFKFKMIGSSAQESDMIKNICNTFRGGLYPEGDMLALHYPPTWTIRFMLGTTDITYIPKIWECYLTSLNVSYNSSSNLWHTDGSPLECDVTVAFKETRALTHKDILDLEKNSFSNISNKNNRNIPKEVKPNDTNNNR